MNVDTRDLQLTVHFFIFHKKNYSNVSRLYNFRGRMWFASFAFLFTTWVIIFFKRYNSFVLKLFLIVKITLNNSISIISLLFQIKFFYILMLRIFLISDQFIILKSLLLKVFFFRVDELVKIRASLENTYKVFKKKS